MKITDKNGKILSREEAIAAGYGHLLDDAISLRCSKCRRLDVGATRGDLCNLTQPDGSICDGRFN